MKTSQIITAKMRTKSFASQLRRAFRFTVLPHGFRKNIIATRNERNIQILPNLMARWQDFCCKSMVWFFTIHIEILRDFVKASHGPAEQCSRMPNFEILNLGQTKKRSWAAALNLGLRCAKTGKVDVRQGMHDENTEFYT